ncbi:MAG: Smr/MutS family protein [Chitinispirillaceae bacterium]|nr:Smr/MutS family protein [Chitinispirillaceae bacterium]
MTSRRLRNADAILAHIERHGIDRKDEQRGDTRLPHASRRGGRKHSHRMTLDLHGLRSDDAARRLRFALERCTETGMRELLVIHGYGIHSDPAEGPVLKKLVRGLLDRELRLQYRTYRTAALRDGGEGATLVAVR